MDQRAHLHRLAGHDPWEFQVGLSSNRPRATSVQRAADTTQVQAERPRLGRPATQPPQLPRILAQPSSGVNHRRPQEEPTEVGEIQWPTGPPMAGRPGAAELRDPLSRGG